MVFNQKAVCNAENLSHFHAYVYWTNKVWDELSHLSHCRRVHLDVSFLSIYRYNWSILHYACLFVCVWVCVKSESRNTAEAEKYVKRLNECSSTCSVGKRCARLSLFSFNYFLHYFRIIAKLHLQFVLGLFFRVSRVSLHTFQFIHRISIHK